MSILSGCMTLSAGHKFRKYDTVLLCQRKMKRIVLNISGRKTASTFLTSVVRNQRSSGVVTPPISKFYPFPDDSHAQHGFLWKNRIDYQIDKINTSTSAVEHQGLSQADREFLLRIKSHTYASEVTPVLAADKLSILLDVFESNTIYLGDPSNPEVLSNFLTSPLNGAHSPYCFDEYSQALCRNNFSLQIFMVHRPLFDQLLSYLLMFYCDASKAATPLHHDAQRIFRESSLQEFTERIEVRIRSITLRSCGITCLQAIMAATASKFMTVHMTSMKKMNEMSAQSFADEFINYFSLGRASKAIGVSGKVNRSFAYADMDIEKMREALECVFKKSEYIKTLLVGDKAIAESVDRAVNPFHPMKITL